MDNLAHSLAGAALGEAGLKAKTGLGLATLILAANLPDVDVFGLLVGENLAWRRGWTHGPVAMLVLPPLLVAAIVAFNGWQTRRGTRPEARPPLHVGWLLALAYIGWLSHPLLDFLNTYGIRFLMPFSERWFYGDALFIIDVWLWTILAAGAWLSRRRRRQAEAQPGRPALASLGLAGIYIALMGAGSVVAERLAAHAAEADGFGPVRTAVASPVPVDPFRRQVVVASPQAYRFGEVRWTPMPQLTLSPDEVPVNMSDPVLAAARAYKPVADFLYWSRLPFATVDRRPDATFVTVSDARYSDGAAASRFRRIVRLPPDGPDQTQGAPDRP